MNEYYHDLSHSVQASANTQCHEGGFVVSVQILHQAAIDFQQGL